MAKTPEELRKLAAALRQRARVTTLLKSAQVLDAATGLEHFKRQLFK